MAVRQGLDTWVGQYSQVHAHFHYPASLMRDLERLPLVENEGHRRARYAPDVIHEALREHLDAQGFEDIQIGRLEASERPYWSDFTDPFVEAAADAVEAAFGQPAVRSPSMSGTAPMYQVCAAHKVPMVMIGGADLRAQAHAPDESYDMNTAARAAFAFLRLLDNVSRLPRRMEAAEVVTSDG